MSMHAVPGGRRTLNDIASEEIRVMMVRRGVRQVHLAHLLGLSQGAISERVRGRLDWRLSELEQIAGFLRVPVGTLLGMEKAPGPSSDDDGPTGPRLPRLDSNQQPFD